MELIANFPSPVELVIRQDVDQVKIRLISQLIKGILRVLQKLLKYFNSTAILTSFVLPTAGVFPFIFTLDLNDSESVKVLYDTASACGLSMLCCHKFPDVFE